MAAFIVLFIHINFIIMFLFIVNIPKCLQTLRLNAVIKRSAPHVPIHSVYMCLWNRFSGQIQHSSIAFPGGADYQHEIEFRSKEEAQDSTLLY